MKKGTCRKQRMLIYQIERKRRQMMDYANIYGINSKVTIQCSQELDKLLNRLDRKIYRQTA